MRPLIRDVSIFFMVVLVLASLWTVCYWAGFRYNLTPSVPVGLYRLHPIDRPLKRNDIVWLCPPDTPLFRKARDEWKGVPQGDCPGGFMHLFKPVAALPGDLVEVTSQGVFVNGKIIPNSQPMSMTASGHRLNPAFGKFKVQTGSVWLVSHFSSQSFDSRYFGAISLCQIHDWAKPLWVKKYLEPIFKH
jgi:conjugative transfer signal peptidase TraF